jgi:hypothetical protein
MFPGALSPRVIWPGHPFISQNCRLASGGSTHKRMFSSLDVLRRSAPGGTHGDDPFRLIRRKRAHETVEVIPTVVWGTSKSSNSEGGLGAGTEASGPAPSGPHCTQPLAVAFDTRGLRALNLDEPVFIRLLSQGHLDPPQGSSPQKRFLPPFPVRLRKDSCPFSCRPLPLSGIVIQRASRDAKSALGLESLVYVD